MTEYLKHQQIYTMLKMIESTQKMNHDITGIFFFGTSVISLNKNVKLGKFTRNIPEAIERLSEEGIPIYACQTWADNYGVNNENIVNGPEVLGLGELSNIVCESDKLVAFGAHT